MTNQQKCPRCGAGMKNDSWVCDTCIAVAKVDLTEVADFLSHLDDKRAKRGTNFPKGGGGRSAETPLPYDPRVHRVTTTARGSLTTWVRLTIDEHKCSRLPSPVDTARISRMDRELTTWRAVHREAKTLDAAQQMTIRSIVRTLLEDRDAAKQRATLDDLAHLVTFLTGHMDWIATRPWVADLADDAAGVHDDLKHLFDNPPETMALGRCEGDQGDGTVCDHILAAPIGAKAYECPRCGIHHDVEQRRLDLIRKSDDFLVTAKEGARLLRLGGYTIDGPKMYAVIRLVGVNSKLRTKSVTSGRAVEHYGLGSLREALMLCEGDDAMRKALDETRSGRRGRGEHSGATLSA